MLVLTGENGVASIELREDTTQTPHIDGHTIRHAKNDFRRPIKSALDVGVYLFVLETTRTKVDHLDFGAHWVSKQNILGLEIAVDNPLVVKKYQSPKKLLRKSTNKFQGESSEVMRLDEFIEIHPKEFGRDTEVASEVEALGEIDNVMTAMRILNDAISFLSRPDRGYRER